MLPKFKTIVTAVCFFGLVPGAIFFYVFHSNQQKKSLALKRDPVVSKASPNTTREQSFRLKGVDGASPISGRPSRASRNVTTVHRLDKNEVECFPEGSVSGRKKSTCVCKKGWHGRECSIPDAVWFTEDFGRWYSEGLIRRRSRPRKVINGLVFNHELDLLEIRIKELGDAVDYYLVVESTYTYFGSEKPLYLRNNLSAGFLREHTHKIVPIAVDFYNYAEGDPWGPENYCRTSVWYEGHRRLKNIRDDDLFIMSDADEIPSRDVVLFLKHHDGFGEPIKLRLRWFTYGFYWENSDPVDVSGVCTVSYIRHVYENDSLRLRSMRTFRQNNMPNTGTFSEMWTIEGIQPRYAGWHCSWCFDVEGIQMKLAAAQRDDGVRWGDIAEKSDTSYIISLRKKGLFFDERSKLTPCDPNETAPAYVRENAAKFMCLMRP
ncbi:beta-1,4-mannosyl-glycoprotein 4-beta-N-acetylglucosaminyltransferase isoform X2 [Rhipicephalus sanguineus]|uniref:beta-1,4-mannosyl-glycoprotein 4-beta-N-acetylglucosaminyltransferase isoform X2 n=1 Tax=Rhipicephalus sanguineus TaxID=34632 RepID=UPI0020C504F5|nr:beta-1,4-mannosyl-glycoprotein 4-beta-N-acetylglucosaminyltransferase isoform X2 [Rhipicephalus sanguineus]